MTPKTPMPLTGPFIGLFIGPFMRLLTLWLLALVLGMPGLAQAQTSGAAGRDFDHLRSGFALTGAHATARCESCHAGGRFQGTPRDCESCHVVGGRLAQGNVVKTAAHFPTTQSCDSCHQTRSFSGARMNHAGVARGSCASCHNGQSAPGKSPDHLRTTASCDSCHGNNGWRPVRAFDHAGVAPGSCDSCHNGSTATGRPAGHVAYQTVAGGSGARCDTCHKGGFRTWTPAKVHSNLSIAAQCSSCHLAVRPATAVHVGQTVCETCHRSTATWSGARVDHASFTVATNCSSCHNGTAASGKPATHVPSGATNCIACHGTSTWRPSSFNHTQVPVTAQCASCHNGSFPPADGKPATHVPYQLVATLAAANCDTCHKAGFASWLPARVHANASVTTQCSSCHLAVRPATAVHVGQTVCETCHRSTATWSGARVDHASFTVATNCSSCHNGTAASGKPATHVPSGATNCIACHGTSTWRPSSFNHTQVPVTAQCASCHSGSFPPADGKPATHVPYQLVATLAAANCDTCHRSGFASWANARVHATATVTGQCKTCHNGSYAAGGARGKPSNHIPESQLLNGAAMECNTCHRSTTAWTVTMDHNGSLGGGAGWCKGCHASGTSYAGGMERKALTHERKTPPAIDCSESGCHRPLGTRGTTYRNWD